MKRTLLLLFLLTLSALFLLSSCGNGTDLSELDPGNIFGSSSSGSGSEPQAQTCYPYLTREIVKIDDEGDGTFDEKWTLDYSYDASGNRVEDYWVVDYGIDGTDDYLHVNTYTYDERLNMVHVENEFDTDNDGTLDFLAIQNSVFDGNDQELERTIKSDRAPVDGAATGENDTVRAITYTYDTAGNLLEEYSTSVRVDTGILYYIVTITNTYDTYDRLTKSVNARDNDANGIVDVAFIDTYAYNTSGNILTHIWETYHPPLDKTSRRDTRTYTYDINERREGQVFEVDYYADGNIDTIIHHTYTYDADSNLLSLVCYVDTDVDGSTDIILTETSTYDANGNRTSFVYEEDHDLDGTADRRRESSTYTYDTGGNMLTFVYEEDDDADGSPEYVEDYAYSYTQFCGESMTEPGPSLFAESAFAPVVSSSPSKAKAEQTPLSIELSAPVPHKLRGGERDRLAEFLEKQGL